MALNGFAKKDESKKTEKKTEQKQVVDTVQTEQDVEPVAFEPKRTSQKTSLSKHPKSAKKEVSKKPEIPDTSGTYRNIPSSVMRAIRAEFPDATNHTDALMAYLACHGSGLVAERCDASLTPAQRELVKNWTGDSYSAIVTQMEQLVSKFEKMAKTTEVIELLATYMVYDRLGFRNDNPRLPKETNLREDGVVDLVMAAEEQAVGFQHEKRTIQGRPIRG